MEVKNEMALLKEGTLTEKEVDELEKEINRKFPQDYRKFLMATNGGYMDGATINDTAFVVDEIKEELIYIDAFFGKSSDRDLDLVYWNKEFSDILPDDVFVFASDLSHGYLAYKCNEKTICFWDRTHQFRASVFEPAPHNTHFAANNIPELMEKINSEVPKDFVPRRIRVRKNPKGLVINEVEIGEYRTFLEDVKKAESIAPRDGVDTTWIRANDGHTMHEINKYTFDEFATCCDGFVIRKGK
ncbi:MAG: SMI1/KNR4 family protein [Acutalibacteraceae bacterium]|nr:SMI1/KNR4 family protein [Acutalibacteraceae bacterium]